MELKTYLKGEIKMDDKNYKLLNEVIKHSLDGLSLFESGTKAHSDAVEDIATLYKLKIEEEKMKLDNDLKVKQLEEQIDKNEKEVERVNAELELKAQQMDADVKRFDTDVELKERQFTEQINKQAVEFENAKTIYENDCIFREKQLSEQKKDRYLRIGLEVASIIVPLMFYRKWMEEGFKFEETGTYTSTTFRGLIGKFRPTR